MPDGVTFKLTGADELARILESKPPILARQIIRGSLRGSVEPWRQEMIARVKRGWHVFERTKVKGVRKSFAGRSREFGVIARNVLVRSQIGAGGFEGSAAVYPSKRAYWSKFLEFGTRKMKRYPFVEPAFEARKNDVLGLFMADVRDQLHKELNAR